MFNKAYSIIMFFALQADQKQINKGYIFRVSVLWVSEKTLCSNFL